jgi:predicted membrane protein
MLRLSPHSKYLFFALSIVFAVIAEYIFINPELSYLGRCKRSVLMQVPSMLFAICALWLGRKSPWWQKFACELLLFVIAYECYFRRGEWTAIESADF